MRCEEIREWLSAELDGEARPRERAAVCRHLAACADCRRAREAAALLRQEIAAAAWAPADEPRDEIMLAALRAEGLLRTPGIGMASGCLSTHNQPGQNNLTDLACRSADVSPLREILELLASPLRSGLASALRQDLQRQPMARMGRSLHPAVAALVVSFLVTWGSLRWAETGRAARLSVPAPGSLSAVVRVRPPDAAMLDEWMAGVPTLAALSQLQRLPAPATMAPAPTRRGAVTRMHPRVG